MKTKSTYPMNAKRAITFFIAGFFLIQVHVMANESSNVNQNYGKAENTCSFINEDAIEEEMAIETWMANPEDWRITDDKSMLSYK